MSYVEGIKGQALVEAADEVLSLWWLWIVKGVLAVIFGVAAWAWPDLTLTTLIWLLGAYLVADGILDIVGFFTHHELSWGRRILIGLWGIAMVVAGIVLWVAPDLGAVTLMVIFGVWAMLTGMFLIVSAFTSDGHLMSPWLQALLGLLGVLIGIYLVVEPGRGALATTWVIGVIAIVYGIASIVGGFRMRSLHKDLQSGLRAAPAR